MEDIELPDPKYIYHPGLESGEDDLFLFAESGDVACPSCERLYTADQLRAAILADREKRAQAAQPVATVEIVAPHLRSIVVRAIPGNPLPSVGDLLYTAPTEASKPVPAENANLRRFLDRAAAEGCKFDGIDAFDLYMELFPEGNGKPVQAEAPTASNEREAFEAHAQRDMHDVTRMPANPEIYDCNYTQVMWKGWQLKSRAALATQPTASNAGERAGFVPYDLYEAACKKADAATATVYQFHYAMKDAGWHPGRTDDNLCDIIRAKALDLNRLAALAQVPEQVAGDSEELALFEHTDEQFGDCNETDTPAAMLMKWANKGWLECTHYEVTALGRKVLEEYRAARTSGEANHG